MFKFGPDADAVVSTIDAPFLTLFEAIGSGSVARIWCKRKNARCGKALNADERKKLMPSLLDACGEMYSGRWAASSETCRKLDYDSIFVHIETAVQQMTYTVGELANPLPQELERPFGNIELARAEAEKASRAMR